MHPRRSVLCAAALLAGACLSSDPGTSGPLTDGKADGVDVEIVIRASSGPSLLGAFACDDLAGCELTVDAAIASTTGTFGPGDGISLALHAYDESAGELPDALGDLIEADTIPAVEGTAATRVLRTDGVGEFAFVASAAGNWASDELAIVRVRASWTPLDGDLGVDCVSPRAEAIAESPLQFALPAMVASVDPGEGVHVAHTLRNEDNTWQLRHIYRHRTGELELIDDAVEATTSAILKLAIGPAGTCATPPCGVALAYQLAAPKQLRFAEFDGSWTIETVGTSDVVALDLAVGPDGVARIVDVDRTDKKLHYAERAASGWQRVAIEPSNEFAFDVSMVVDGSGAVHVVHSAAAPVGKRALRYGVCATECTDADNWAIFDVFRVDGTSTPRFAFALDGSEVPHVLHNDVAKPEQVRLAVGQLDGSFSSKTLLDGVSMFNSLSMEFDADDTLHIVTLEGGGFQHHSRRHGAPGFETESLVGQVLGFAVRRAMFWVLRSEAFGPSGKRLRMRPYCQ